jgi:hypothetical protein
MKMQLLALLLVLLPACKRTESAHGDPDVCQKACDHVARLRLARQINETTTKVHEADEKVDEVEEFAEKSTADLRQQMAASSTLAGPGPKALEKLSPADRRQVLARLAWEENQLKFQRELGLKRNKDTVAEAKKQYEEIKRRSEEDEKNAIDAEIKKCLDPCVQRAATLAACLQRTQAVEDVAVCEHQ